MILVGTMHLDLEGPRRLENLLNRFRPKRISVECPKGTNQIEVRDSIINHRRKTQRIIRGMRMPDNYQKQMLEYQEVKAYEIATILDYCRTNRCSAFFVDHPAIPVTFSCEGFREALESQVKIIPQSSGQPYESLRKRTVEIFDLAYYDLDLFKQIEEMARQLTPPDHSESTTNNLSYTENPFLRTGFEEERERFMASEILGLRPNLHVGGVAHVFEEFKPIMPMDKQLYELLGDFVTQRIRLCEEPIK